MFSEVKRNSFVTRSNTWRVGDGQGGEAVTTLPTIHLNGSSRHHLVEAYHAALLTLREAIDSVRRTEPNARDYYVTGEHSYAAARSEHVERLRKLEAVEEELRELWRSVRTRTGGEQ